MNVTGPDVPYLFAFEEQFDPEEHKAWMQKWWKLSIVCSTVYAVAIHAGQRAMSKRPAFDLRGLMAAWSALLAVFSICGTIRVLPTVRHIIKNFGWYHLICDYQFFYFTGSGFWTWAFATSKLFELGDTVFIVLRKQKLSFLHWYHHVTVFIYCWFSYAYDSPSGLVFGAMNYAVHGLMYTYYTLRALRVYVPNVFSMILTSLQILQMFVGIVVSVIIYILKGQGHTCPETNNNLALAFAMYFTYFILFAHFFYERYLLRGKRTPNAKGEMRNGLKGAANGVKDTTNEVKVTANGVKDTNNEVKVAANGVKDTKNGVNVTTNGVSKRINGVNGHCRSESNGISNGHFKSN